VSEGERRSAEADQPKPITLRPYQARDIERLRAAYAAGARAVCYCLPTGGGKTVVFAYVTEGAVDKGRRVAVIAHRRELVRQAADKLAWAGVPHGILAAGLDRDHDAPVLVMSVQTAARRLDRLPEFDFIVIDEAHHAIANTWTRVIGRFPRAKVLGVTATPARLDGRGLGVEAGGVFDALTIGATVLELQEEGFLARTRVFVPARLIDTRGLRTQGGDFAVGELAERASAVTGDAVVEYRKRADHQPALAYGCTIAHAKSIARAFRAAGYRAQCVHGGLPAAQRDALIRGLATGAVEVLASCDLISEGLDVPSVGAVILLRPTQSLVLAMQQIGRGMRPSAVKEALIVLDHAGNCLTHGLPETKRAWTLDSAPKGSGHAPGWRCDKCGRLNHLSAARCQECGAGAERSGGKGRRHAPDAVAGSLSEMSPEVFARLARIPYRRFVARPRTEGELRAYAQAHGYKAGWVWHRLYEQEASLGSMQQAPKWNNPTRSR
jgi:superfamily II DNA or RNA helicase